MPEQRLDSLRDLLVEEVRDLYDAEHQIIAALPKMISGASSARLKQKFEKHLQETKEQVGRLERVFALLDLSPAREPCVGMAGLLKEGQKVLEMKGEPAVCDAALIGAAQKVEHYEIAGYGTARTFAQTLGLEEVARLLQRTLTQEAATDELLTDLAQSSINRKAA